MSLTSPKMTSMGFNPPSDLPMETSFVYMKDIVTIGNNILRQIGNIFPGEKEKQRIRLNTSNCTRDLAKYTSELDGMEDSYMQWGECIALDLYERLYSIRDRYKKQF